MQLPDNDDVASEGHAYGIALAEFAIETFVSDLTKELAETAAGILRSEMIERGGEMMDKGVQPALAIAWGNACAKALQERLAREGGKFRLIAELLASPRDVLKQ